MPALLAEFRATDVVVFATPLYHYSMSSIMKTVLERTFPLTQPGLESTPRGLFRNRARYAGEQGKGATALVTGALKDARNFEPACETFRLSCDAMGLKTGAMLIRPESHLLQFSLAKPKTIKSIEASFVEAGRELATTGLVSDKVAASAAQPIAADSPHFQRYSNIYWEHAVRLGPRSLAPGALADVVGRDVRILMHEMVRSFDPVPARRLTAILEFVFTDLNLRYHVDVRDGGCVLNEGGAEGADLRIECTSEVWADIVQLKLDPRAALREKVLVLAGDRALFNRFPRFFPLARG